LDLKDLFFVFKKHILLILAVTVTAGIVLFIVAKCFLKPVYESQATLIINVTSPSTLTITDNDVALSQKLIDTYAIILKGNTILGQVKQDLGLDMSVKQLADEISVKGVGTTQVLILSVKDAEPDRASAIAGDIITCAPAEISRTVKTGSIEVISPAETDNTPVSPNVPVFTIIGVIAGLFISCILTLIFDMLSDKLRSEEDIKNKLGYAIIGVIPDIGRKEGKNGIRWIREIFNQIMTHS
jgi:capsular polysaccharide biosynthesis protein